MSALRPLKPEKLLKLLGRLGFSVARQRGSHVFLRHADGRTTTVPMHSGEEIDRRLLRKILRDIAVLPEEFLKLK